MAADDPSKIGRDGAELGPVNARKSALLLFEGTRFWIETTDGGKTMTVVQTVAGRNVLLGAIQLGLDYSAKPVRQRDEGLLRRLAARLLAERSRRVAPATIAPRVRRTGAIPFIEQTLSVELNARSAK